MRQYADIGLETLIGLDEEEYIPRRSRDVDVVPRGTIAGQAQVTAPSGLRLRAETNASSESLAIMPVGSIVGVGPSNTPGWAFVEYAGKYGYASNEWLKPVGGPDHDNRPIEPVPPPPPAPAPVVPPPAPPAPPPDPGMSLGKKLLYATAITAAVVGPAILVAKGSKTPRTA